MAMRARDVYTSNIFVLSRFIEGPEDLGAERALPPNGERPRTSQTESLGSLFQIILTYIVGAVRPSIIPKSQKRKGSIEHAKRPVPEETIYQKRDITVQKNIPRS